MCVCVCVRSCVAYACTPVHVWYEYTCPCVVCVRVHLCARASVFMGNLDGCLNWSCSHQGAITLLVKERDTLQTLRAFTLCVCVCVCVFCCGIFCASVCGECVRVCTRVCARVCTHALTRVCVCTHARVCVCVCVCERERVCACVHACAHACV